MMIDSPINVMRIPTTNNAILALLLLIIFFGNNRTTIKLKAAKIMAFKKNIGHIPIYGTSPAGK